MYPTRLVCLLKPMIHDKTLSVVNRDLYYLYVIYYCFRSI